MPNYTTFGTADPGATAYNGGGFTLGMEFSVSARVWLLGLRFWREVTANSYGTPVGRLYTVTTATTGAAVSGSDVTFASQPAGSGSVGWKEATVATPITLTAGQRYRAAIVFSAYFSALNGDWSSTGSRSAGATSGPLTAYSQTAATGQLQGQYTSGTTLSYPSLMGSPGGNNYFVDITVTDVDPSGRLQTQFFPVMQ